MSIELKQRMKKGMRERVSGGDVCGCSFGEPFKQETFQTSLYIQMLLVSTFQSQECLQQ